MNGVAPATDAQRYMALLDEAWRRGVDRDERGLDRSPAELAEAVHAAELRDRQHREGERRRP